MSVFRNWYRAPVLALSVVACSATYPMQARSADFGGDCCADLEQRVAELEAITARKRTRSVSLTLYGQVNTGILYWDDGHSSDAYIVDNDNWSTRFGVMGSGDIRPGLTAGYQIEIEAEVASSDFQGVGRFDDDGNGIDAIGLRQANWWIASERLGTVTVGQASQATDGIAELDYGFITGGNYSGMYANGEAITARSTDGGFVTLPLDGFSVGPADEFFWFYVFGEHDGDRLNVVRYDSPAFAGFTVSASWGEDDIWDVAGKFTHDFGSFQVQAGIGYVDYSRSETGETLGYLGGRANHIGASGSIWHTATGLFVTAMYGTGEYHDATVSFVKADTGSLVTLATEDSENWYVKTGINRKLVSLGNTVIAVEYGEADNITQTVHGETWGVGFQQSIDDVGAEAYVSYRNKDADFSGLGYADTEEVQTVLGGMRVPF